MDSRKNLELAYGINPKVNAVRNFIVVNFFSILKKE